MMYNLVYHDRERKESLFREKADNISNSSLELKNKFLWLLYFSYNF